MARHRTRHDAVMDQYARELRSLDELFPLDGGGGVASPPPEAQVLASAAALPPVAPSARSAPASRSRAVA
jgi:hypothetical protein